MAGQLVLIVLASAAVALAAVLLSFIAALYVQRRRARALRERQRAAEEAERRRRKRRRNGLRSADIDAVAPERRVVVAVAAATATVAAAQSTGLPAKPHDPTQMLALAELDESEDDASAKGDAASGEVASAVKGAGGGGGSGGGVASDGGGGGSATGAVEAQKLGNEPLPTSLAEGEETCAVCLDELEPGNLVRRLPCDHVFHSTCIRQWLRRKNACPCCCAQVVQRRKKKKKRRPHEHPLSEDAAVPAEFVDTADDPSAAPHLQHDGQDQDQHRYPLPSPPHISVPVDGVLAGSPLDTSGAHSAAGRADVDFDVGIDALGAAGGTQHHAVPNVRAHQMMPSPLAPGLPGALSDRAVAAGRSSRPLSAAATSQGVFQFPRSGSLLDPENPDSEMLASEASAAFEDIGSQEPMDQLLEHVRRVIRGEASQISIGAYSTDVEDDAPDVSSVPDVPPTLVVDPSPSPKPVLSAPIPPSESAPSPAPAPAPPSASTTTTTTTPAPAPASIV